MDNKIETKPPQPQAFQFMMVPVPPKQEPELRKEAQSSNIFGTFLWIAILLLALWFMAGGWETLR